MARTSKEEAELAGCLGGLLKWIFLIPFLIAILPAGIAYLLYKNKAITKKKALLIGIFGTLAWLGIISLFSGNNSDSNTDVSTDTTRAVQTATQEQNGNPANTPVPINSVEISIKQTELFLNERTAISATVSPKNASDKAVRWKTSDPSVAIIKDGEVVAVGGGIATITATAGERSDSVQVTVDGTKVAMQVRINYARNNPELNIGNDWYMNYTIDNNSVSGGIYPFEVGKGVTFSAEIGEDDDLPDVGYGSKWHLITEQDIKEGFTETFTVYVTENGGKNRGKSAVFEVKFTVSAIK